MALPKLSGEQIGYGSITLLFITAFIFEAGGFCFNHWYRMEFSALTIRWGLWEMKLEDNDNITGLVPLHGRKDKLEYRMYGDDWKNILDRLYVIAKLPPVTIGKGKNKQYIAPTLPTTLNEQLQPVKDSVWDQGASNIHSAETLYSMAWAATFVLMCLLTFHQFLPTFVISLAIIRIFSIVTLVTGIFLIFGVASYGHTMPSICSTLNEAFQQSTNPAVSQNPMDDSPCSFGAGFSMSIFAGIFLLIAAVVLFVHVLKFQKDGVGLNLGFNTAPLEKNEPVFGGASAVPGPQPTQVPLLSGPSTSAGYQSSGYQGGGRQPANDFGQSTFQYAPGSGYDQ